MSLKQNKLEEQMNQPLSSMNALLVNTDIKYEYFEL